MISLPCARGRSWCGCAAVLIGLCCLPSRTFAQPYQADIDRWTDQDALDPPAGGSILFTGSSSIRRYEQLALDFADYKIIQRGFGGSQFEDLNGFVNDIVLPYNPSAIVVWEGTNDIASGETGNEVFADDQNFVNLVHTAQPAVDIFYLGIMPTPGRFANGPEETVANTSIANFAAGDPKLHYVDLPTAFNALNPPSDPAFTSLFVDSIHLNCQGYEFWTSIIRPGVEAVIAPNKVFAANPNTPPPGSRILFDFGPSNAEDGDQTLGTDANGNIWNNWHQAEGGVAVNAGEHLGNLVDDSGAPTGIDLTITGGFSTNGKLNGGLLAPNPVLLGDFAVATATQDYFFSSADNQQGGGSDDGVYDGNDDEIASVAGIRPDQFGQIFVDQTLLAGSFAYLNAMEITVDVPEPTTATSAVFATVMLFAFIGRTRRR